MKTCSTCKETKPLNAYCKHDRHEDGLHYQCKACKAQYDAQRYKYNKGNKSKKSLRSIKKQMNRSMGLKTCSTCKETKPIDAYFKGSQDKDGLSYDCKACKTQHKKDNRELYCAYQALRQLRKVKATPDWVDKEEIKQIYINCPKGYHVDHIYPLKHKEFCGLHVIANLQYLTATENCQKRNKRPEKWS